MQVSRCNVGHCEQRATVRGEPVPAALPPAAAQEVLQEAGARSCQGQGPVSNAALDHGKGPCAAMSCILNKFAILQQLMGIGKPLLSFSAAISMISAVAEWQCAAQQQGTNYTSTANVCSFPLESANFSTVDNKLMPMHDEFDTIFCSHMQRSSLCNLAVANNTLQFQALCLTKRRVCIFALAQRIRI